MTRPPHPGELLLATLAWLALALTLPPLPWAPVQLAATTAVALLHLRIPPRRWFLALGAPGTFSLLAVFPLAWNASFDFAAAPVWTPPLRSFAASSALLLLGLSTPITDLLHLARRLRIPAPGIDLAFLLHRFALAALDVAAAMTRALSLRAPRATWRRQIRASAWLSASLFQRMLARAHRADLGLAARGVNACIVPPAPVSAFSLARALALLATPAALAAAALLPERWR